MLTKISNMIDAVADRLETKGLIKEAYELDKISNQLSDVEEDKIAELMGNYLTEYQHIKNLRRQFSDRRNLIIPDEKKLIIMRKNLLQQLSSLTR